MPEEQRETNSSGISSEVLDPEGHSEISEGTRSSATDGQASGGESSLSEQAAKGVLKFNNPLLKGKSPEEIEALFETQQRAIREQNTELNRLHEASAQTPRHAEGVGEEEEEEAYGSDFLAPRFKKMEDRLTKAMQAAVAPLRERGARDESNTTRTKLRSELKHFTLLEPHIDQLLRDQGANPLQANESMLRTIYHTAVGFATERGLNLNTSSEGTGHEEQPVNIPQHRPSAAPVPSGEQRRTARRQLTEHERILAHQQFGGTKDPEGEFLRLQELPEDEIVQPGFSKEGW